jgi:hypothetical protein
MNTDRHKLNPFAATFSDISVEFIEMAAAEALKIRVAQENLIEVFR